MCAKCAPCHSEFCFEDYRLRVAGKKNRVLQTQTTKSSPKKDLEILSSLFPLPIQTKTRRLYYRGSYLTKHPNVYNIAKRE